MAYKLRLWINITSLFLLLGVYSLPELYGVRDIVICPKISRYKITAIGRTDMPPNELSRFNLPMSFAPRISNEGEVIYNTTKGGILWNTTCSERRLPYKDDYMTFFHAISKNGMILVSASNKDHQPDWMLWPKSACIRQNLLSITVDCDQGGVVYYRDLNSKGALAGTLVKMTEEGEKSYAAMRTSEGRLNVLCPGSAWSISEENYIVANDTDDWSNRPYLWHPKGGKVILSDNIQMRTPKGDVRYLDMTFGYDGSVYGSFYFWHKPQHLYPYHWEGCEDNFAVMGKCGIRVSAVNASQSIVGSLNGRAIVQHRDGQTYDLTQVIDAPHQDWLLLEATDINDLGQIVGYGYYNGDVNIFLLEPSRPVVNYYITQ